MGCSGSKDGDPAKPEVGGGLGPEPVKEEFGNGDGKAADEVEEKKLSPAQLKKIQDLFNEFDIDSLGKLPLAHFASSSLKFGPHESDFMTQLEQMDYDSDGFITKDEWEKYYTATAGLSEDEFNVIVEHMSNAASQITTIIRCTRLAAEPAPAPPTDDVDELPALPAGRVAKVEELFSAWDVAGTGTIDRRKLKASGGTLGPHKVQIFSTLDQMDANKDNLVTKDEMLHFFQAAASLGDDEFMTLVDEMNAVAQDSATIQMLMSMASEYDGGAPPAEDLEAVPPLKEERLEQLKMLWSLLSNSLDKPISLAEMKQAESGSKIGPHSVSVLKEMYAMDSNSDGKLQWSELLDYFTKASASLTDAEFTEIVGDMTTRIQMQLLAQMVME
ncbi:hypothetical protein AB1Y20_009500 [Prymnesium parvum]|uniref:EF-hand domain-containing protein n=1 Tax=Prymnesium parvum TaxID=97485 RepID=A0AB34J298_PRYPA|mmetsp:Transcript_18002/g.43057  ORF Transcript_18002/g.43057 Transcript_18002/m.43057 type:complete len:387 (-) Transcript_18002:428-1588(-)